MFGQFGQQSGDRSVRPSSEDPLGDPGDRFGNIKSANEDPLGDPARGFGNIKSASEDPLGDPG
ncbi:MAG: translation initiation factor [Cyanobacteria bacterium SZAS-4]|nr:translation initiation factor [Cyanobacteria bacterium SZAS-4]